jgi:uncharacterized phage-associated protein
MKIPISKLKAIILFFGNCTDTKFLGKVKLMKLFYFIDFLHVKKYGVPITYDTYVNLEHGPIPSAIKNLVDTASDDIDNSILSDIIKFETPPGTNMSRVIPLGSFTKKEEKLFSNTELEILKEVCARFSDSNTKTIEDASHREAPWRETKLLETISYTLAAKDSDCMVSEEEISMAMKVL